MKSISQDEFLAEAKARFGDKARNWKFVCPACGTMQSVQQLQDAVVASGGTKDDVHRYIAFSCIGRFNNQGDAGISAKNKGQPWDKGCNWTLGGLLRIHTLEVLIDGKPRPTFELAEASLTPPAAK